MLCTTEMPTRNKFYTVALQLVAECKNVLGNKIAFNDDLNQILAEFIGFEEAVNALNDCLTKEKLTADFTLDPKSILENLTEYKDALQYYNQAKVKYKTYRNYDLPILEAKLQRNNEERLERIQNEYFSCRGKYLEKQNLIANEIKLLLSLRTTTNVDKNDVSRLNGDLKIKIQLIEQLKKTKKILEEEYRKSINDLKQSGLETKKNLIKELKVLKSNLEKATLDLQEIEVIVKNKIHIQYELFNSSASSKVMYYCLRVYDSFENLNQKVINHAALYKNISNTYAQDTKQVSSITRNVPQVIIHKILNIINFKKDIINHFFTKLWNPMNGKNGLKTHTLYISSPIEMRPILYRENPTEVEIEKIIPSIPQSVISFSELNQKLIRNLPAVLVDAHRANIKCGLWSNPLSPKVREVNVKSVKNTLIFKR